MFSTAEGSGWSLIATVDTRDLGEGGVHASEVTGADGAMGPYRWLLWVSPAKQMGTFFAEIDIDFADGE